MGCWAVRRLTNGDEALLRRLRIAALTDAPVQFGSTLDREESRSDADWQRWFAPGATFVAERDGAAHGLVCAVPAREDPDVLYLMSMWVAPEQRGTGAADALIGALLDWAREQPADTIRLDVVEDNASARRVYERHGFRATGATWERKGRTEVVMERPAR